MKTLQTRWICRSFLILKQYIMWTRFFDMASGGTSKTDYNVIYIELPKQEAIEYFENRFDTHPYNVTCSCCGEDFSVIEAEDPIYDNSNLVITKQEIDNDNICG